MPDTTSRMTLPYKAGGSSVLSVMGGVSVPEYEERLHKGKERVSVLYKLCPLPGESNF